MTTKQKLMPRLRPGPPRKYARCEKSKTGYHDFSKSKKRPSYCFSCRRMKADCLLPKDQQTHGVGSIRGQKLQQARGRIAGGEA